MKFVQSIKKENIKMFSFIVIAIISIWMLEPPTQNYIQFYKAVEKLDVSASRGNFIFIPDNYRALITLNLTIGNPTGYRGIGIVSLILTLNLITDNITIELKKGYRVWFKEEPGELLEPYSSINKSEEISLNLENKKDIFEKIKTFNKQEAK